MKIADNMLELIGNTPLVRLSKKINPYPAEVLIKLENFNPMSSVKDRVGAAMLEQAEKDGIIKPGATIIEPTSGNTDGLCSERIQADFNNAGDDECRAP